VAAVKSIKTVMAKTPSADNTISAFFLSFLRFLKEDFSYKKHIPVYIYTALIISLIYYFDFEAWKKSLNLSVFQNTILLTICYAVSFFLPLLWVMKSVKNKFEYKGILIAAVFIVFFAFSSSWSPYYSFSYFTESEYHYWYRKFIANASPFFIFLISYLIFKRQFFSNNETFLWTSTSIKWVRIVLPAIIFVVIIVIIGSQIGDFGSEYPTFKYRRTAGDGIMPALQVISFEAAYALDFYAIELLFRGVLVLGLFKYFGKNVLLPMATLYVFIHYGKPMAETISSFFGAYLLGYLAMYTRSVLPGTVLHISLAWTMELVGALLFVKM